MQDNGKDAQWTNETYHKEIDRKKSTFHGTPICKFILEHIFGYKPSQKNTCHKRAQWHEELRGEMVTTVEKI